jgi:hypothetical protein
MTTTTYTWKIYNLRTADQPETDTVCEVAWGIQGENNNYTVGIGDRTTLVYSAAGEFIAYSQLTEATVIEWIKLSLGEEAVASLKTQIEARLLALQQPQTVVLRDQALPWAPV